MSFAITSSSSNPIPAAAMLQGAAKSVDEAAQIKMQNDLTTVLSMRVSKFRDGTSQIHYAAYFNALSEVLGSYQANTKQEQGYSHNFPDPLLRLIAEFEDEVTFSDPSNSTSASSRRHFVSSIGFGKKMWNNYFGAVGEAPPLPKDLCQILANPCPFFEGKIIAQTHILALVPATIDENQMTLKLLGEQMGKIGKPGYDKSSPVVQSYEKTPFEASHWILMTNTVLKETRWKCYEVQRKMIANHTNYQVPKVAQAVVAIFTEFLATGICRYGRGDLEVYSRCQEKTALGQMIVGLFSLTKGLHVHPDYDYDNYQVAVGALRKL